MKDMKPKVAAVTPSYYGKRHRKAHWRLVLLDLGLLLLHRGVRREAWRALACTWRALARRLSRLAASRPSGA